MFAHLENSSLASPQAFVDDEDDSGYREARRHLKEASLLTASLESFSSPSSLSKQEIRELSPFQTSTSSSSSSSVSIMEITKSLEEEEEEIKDYRSATAASSRAAVAAYAAYNANAMTQAAAARAATRAARSAQQAAVAAAAALQSQANAAQEKEVEEYKSFAAALSLPSLVSSPMETEIDKMDTDQVLNEDLDESEPPAPRLTLDISSSEQDVDSATIYPAPSPLDIDRLNRLFESSSREEALKQAAAGKGSFDVTKARAGEGGDDGRAHVAIQQVWGLVDWAKGLIPQGENKEVGGKDDSEDEPFPEEEGKEASKASSSNSFWSLFKR